MRNQYYHAHIEEIIEHSEDIRSFVLDIDFEFKPGQFAMVWLPGVDEKPFSLSGRSRITVKKVGPFTERLFEKKKDYLDIRGPYGNGFPIDIASNTAIGGGMGIAPLIPLLGFGFPGPNITNFVLAGKNKKDLIFLEDIIKTFEEFSALNPENIIGVTEDGSYGKKGLVTDVDIPKSERNYYICGPEIMMKKVAEKLVNKGVRSDNIYLSLERYMKCVVGICGNCSFSGYSVCTDGPVFRYDKIRDLPHFNKFNRTRTGELVRK